MQLSVTSVRRHFIFINALLIALLLWMTLSFWYDAFVQKKDATLMQHNVEESELSRIAVSDLAAERSFFSAAFSYSEKIQDSNLAKIESSLQSIDLKLDAITDTAIRNHSNKDLVARYNRTTFVLPDWIKSFNKSRSRLDVYRQYSAEQLNLPIAGRDTEIRKTLFNEYSFLIELVEQLNNSSSFIPRHNEMATIDLQNFINRVRKLNEFAKQEVAMLTEFSANTIHSDSRFFGELNSLHTELSRLQQYVYHYASIPGIPDNISNTIKNAHTNYTSKYLPARTQLLFSTPESRQNIPAQSAWSNVVSSYLTSLEQLAINANRELQSIAVTAQKKGIRRLAIDSAIVLACLVIGLISLKLTRAIQHIAYHDSLTNLANRHHFESAVKSAIDSAHHSNRKCAVLLIDLDRFKSINDTYGHNIGDELLKTISHRIQEHCMNVGMPARLGGDEFAVLLNQFDSRSETMDSARQLIQCIEKEVNINGVKLTVGSSIGISIFPDNGLNATELMKSADIAMYSAKTAGNENICLYDEKMLSSYEQRIQTELDLQVAIRNQQFELHYQPQVRVADGRVIGVEALIRWHHPERGMVSPVEFIPVAEEAGMLVELGSWVLDEACNQLAQLHAQGFSDLGMAVNISPQQFNQVDFYEGIIKTLARHDLAHHHLELEVTESIVMTDVDSVVEILQKLRESDIRIAVDDFGTGYSSLQYLQDLPLDVLKIDKVFIDSMNETDSSKSVANSIVQLGKSFELETIAEGVETREQLIELVKLGVEYTQGYYYSKPVSGIEIAAVIREIESVIQHGNKAA